MTKVETKLIQQKKVKNKQLIQYYRKYVAYIYIYCKNIEFLIFNF